MTYEQALEKLAQFGQEHVLQYYGELPAEEQEALLNQISETDFSVVKYAAAPKAGAAQGVITPLSALELSEIREKEAQYREAGLEAIRAGKVGAVLLAGGMGTRLGSDDPKCMYDIGLTHPVYIMERLIANLDEVVKAAGVTVPLFIMTSDKNHDKTVRFMQEHHSFGYDENMIRYFKQDMAPASDYNGKVLMESRSRICTSPNGNGGWFLSMKKSGVLDRVKELGIEWLNIFAVDNVLQRIADPVFVGATILHGCASGAKVVRKAAPDEKVGVMCLENGHPSVVEYYELTPEMMEERNEKGDYAYNFGVIMNYIFREKDLERIVDEVLPMHVVEKKVPYMAADGTLVKPETPNAYKYEQLVLDMVREMDSCLPVEVEREKEFAPIKNRTGVDSVESARALLQKNGVTL